jgi:endoglucanase
MSSKENLKGLLKKYTEIVAPSGFEQEAIKLMYAEIKDHVDEVKISTIGNMVAIKKGSRPGPTIAVGAHMDEVGYIIRSILPSGFLLFDKLGAPPDVVSIGRKVWITSRKIPGILTVKPGHLTTPEEAKMVTPTTKLFIDVGCKTAEEVKALGIRVGDPVVQQTDFLELSNPDLVCTKAIDDRINCAIVTELLKTIKASDFAGTLLGVFTVREETGANGAKRALHGFNVDYAISLDTIPTNDTPDGNIGALPLVLGNGPGMSVCDGVFFPDFYAIHPGVRALIEDVAAKSNINLQTVTLKFASYATDASGYQFTGTGLPLGTLTVPRRYSHSPVELCNMNDADKLLSLLQGVVKANDKINLKFVDL